MLHQCVQVAFVLFAVCVSTTETKACTSRTVLNRDEITDCDTIVRVSHVCYQCSRRHEEEFNMMYISCCTGEPSVREYCEYIYTEPPKRGGLWEPHARRR